MQPHRFSAFTEGQCQSNVLPGYWWTAGVWLWLGQIGDVASEFNGLLEEGN